MKQIFPFGSPWKKVEQQDRSPKKVFVLGANACTVHAKWMDINGTVIAEALPVASEPSVFWNGLRPGQIVKNVQIPQELGKLYVSDKEYNGQLGRILDNYYLAPLGYTRDDIWQCYIFPYPMLSQVESREIRKKYNTVAEPNNIPKSRIPNFYPYELISRSRRDEIVAELQQSKADTIILLGDITIKHFLSHFSKFSALSDFGDPFYDYGKTHKVEISGKFYKVIPLLDPLQAKEERGFLFSMGWNHQHWMRKQWIIRLTQGRKRMTQPSLQRSL